MKQGVSVTPYAVASFFILAFALHPASPIYTHSLSDPDDYMRLNQVLAWIGGQSWYDTSVPRLSPGADTVLHWSRLIDLPIAAVTLLFKPLFGLTDAAMVASFIVPLFWLAALFIVLAKTAAVFFNRAWQQAPFLFFLLSPFLMAQVAPGRVDHHSAQIVLALYGILALHKILLGQQVVFFALTSGITMALGFWVGAESIPWALALTSGVTVTAAFFPNKARTTVLFGLSAAITSTALLFIVLPIETRFKSAVSWFSITYAFYASLTALFLFIASFTTHAMPRSTKRLAVFAFCAAVATLAFFALTPQAASGPFADYNRFDATQALEGISEAQPWAAGLQAKHYTAARLWNVSISFFHLLWLPLLGLTGCVLGFRAARTENKPLWIVQGFYLMLALGMVVFWQLRVGSFMQAFMLIPLCELTRQVFTLLARHWHGRALFAREIGLSAGLFILPALLVPSAYTEAKLYPDFLLFPANHSKLPCETAPILKVLSDPFSWGKSTHTIMADGSIGPEILYRTRHSAISGNFNVPGNADVFAFFSTFDDDYARQIAQKWQTDLVLVCRSVPFLYVGKDYYAPGRAGLKMGADGLLHWVNQEARQPLIDRLAQGHPPQWLKPVEIPDASDYLLYQIQKLDRP